MRRGDVYPSNIYKEVPPCSNSDTRVEGINKFQKVSWAQERRSADMKEKKRQTLKLSLSILLSSCTEKLPTFCMRPVSKTVFLMSSSNH